MGMKFLQLLEDSVILQATLTIGIWGVALYMAVAARPIPDLVSTGAALILGFYFGQKQAQAVRRAIKDASNELSSH